MIYSLVFRLIVLVIVPTELLTIRQIEASQPPQNENKDAQPGNQSPEQAQKEILKSLEDTYPALYKVKPSNANDDELKKLLIERFQTAAMLVTYRFQRYKIAGPAMLGGLSFLDSLLEADQRLLDARLDLVEKPEEEIAVREDWIKCAKEIEKITKDNVEAGKSSIADKHRTRYGRLDAEIQLLKAKRRLKK